VLGRRLDSLNEKEKEGYATARSLVYQFHHCCRSSPRWKLAMPAADPAPRLEGGRQTRSRILQRVGWARADAYAGRAFRRRRQRAALGATLVTEPACVSPTNPPATSPPHREGMLDLMLELNRDLATSFVVVLTIRRLRLRCSERCAWRTGNY